MGLGRRAHKHSILRPRQEGLERINELLDKLGGELGKEDQPPVTSPDARDRSKVIEEMKGEILD